MRTSKPESWNAWLDGVSPYRHAHDDPLVGRRSAEPDSFEASDLGFGIFE